MKKIFTLILGLGMVASANAQMASNVQARVYAYDLQQEETTVPFWETTLPAYKLTFKTNTAATSGKVVLSAEGQNDVEVALDPIKHNPSGDGKAWEVIVSGATAGMVVADYNWKVTVSAPAVDEFVQISDPLSSTLGFYRSFAVAVDNSPESDYFGRVYVVNQTEHKLSSSNRTQRDCYNGIYSLTPELLEEAGAQPHKMSFIGDPSGAYRGSSVNDMTVTADGRVFISSMLATTGIQGVYYVNPNTWEYQRTEITSPIAGIGSYGSGEETQLYCINMTNATDGLVQRYDIGTDNTCSVEPVEYSDISLTSGTNTYELKIKGNKYNTNHYTCNSIDPIGSGFFISQHVVSSGLSTTVGKGVGSALFYCNNDGVGKWAHEATGLNGQYKIANSRNGCLAVNEDLNLVAFTANVAADDSNTGIVHARIFSYTVNSSGSLSTKFIGHFPMTEQGSKSNCLAFDYAGNLYAVNEVSEDLTVYAIPTDNNTRVTPAKSSLVVSIDGDTMDEVTAIEGVNVDANAPIEYYNLQGVKVENPAGGIFIKKQGNKTTKVVL